MLNKIGLFLFIIVVVVFIYNKLFPTSEDVYFPKELEIINRRDSSHSIDLENKYKVVVFHNSDKLSLNAFSETFGWRKTINKYNEVSFIFYFSGKDREKIVEELAKYDFPVPVFFDPDFMFYQKNNLVSENLKNKNLLAYIVYNNQILDMAQIGAYDYFHRQLDELLKE